ncbi:isopentenyl-diphosphate Delta-isomerase [Chromatium okenii]|uniref:Isopentenyl-diphosphate Delta-isomerase n=1 Tax=Chromatium okenii TaxID=61644 RepID=A0A2S7XSL4_9GAMM|nr:isopentenyl-diphosphate Delta-isomerase [Chromatium okenii]PQJ96636.1 isopentenyl-diphosphate Delta-isomerase [Chromatium okenii]
MSARIVPPLAAIEWERAWQRDAIEQVILVDNNDQISGVAGKLDAHRDGLLHRAFSILIFNTHGELLLQRRANGKYHFAQHWSNTCCGHPRPQELTSMAAQRRLKEEFGIATPLTERAQLVYRAEDINSGLIEHEYLHIFYGVYTDDPQPDPSEIGAWRWMKLSAIQRALQLYPHWFTPWFHLLIDKVMTEHQLEPAF